ncbi:MAG: hypothetical protein JWO89_2754 [Verrucomicrobiaceae bacterium]|nr:hypothetical protein [Verrucomicrobiaceae bacterium]MDB6116516.1 hypothetical protein [Verrucomicrobiaceae bacterium]
MYFMLASDFGTGFVVELVLAIYSTELGLSVIACLFALRFCFQDKKAKAIFTCMALVASAVWLFASIHYSRKFELIEKSEGQYKVPL